MNKKIIWILIVIVIIISTGVYFLVLSNNRGESSVLEQTIESIPQPPALPE
jgi:flagellar basal body-associated protein FliL